MKLSDIQGEPCACGECVQAQITDEPIRRDPSTGRWMHGYALRRYYEAWEAFKQQARTAIGAKGRHAKGFERLAIREPGQEG